MELRALKLMMVLVSLPTLLALRLLPCWLNLHFCCHVSFHRVNEFGSPLPAWHGWDFVLICPVAIFPFPQRGFLVLNMYPLCLCSIRPVLWGRLFPSVYVWEHHPYHDKIFPVLKVYVALLGIAKFPYRLPP